MQFTVCAEISRKEVISVAFSIRQYTAADTELEPPIFFPWHFSHNREKL